MWERQRTLGSEKTCPGEGLPQMPDSSSLGEKVEAEKPQQKLVNKHNFWINENRNSSNLSSVWSFILPMLSSKVCFRTCEQMCVCLYVSCVGGPQS